MKLLAELPACPVTNTNTISIACERVLNVLEMKRAINQQVFQIVDLHFIKNLNDFHSFKVVDRVSETQFQVSENVN